MFHVEHMTNVNKMCIDYINNNSLTTDKSVYLYTN